MPTRKTASLPSGRCLICGADLCLPVFDCPDCATPHHSGCWQWTGGCAVYGCARRPRDVSEPERAAEVSLVAAAAARPPTLRPVSRLPVLAAHSTDGEPLAGGRSLLAPVAVHFLMALVLAAMGAGLDSSRHQHARRVRPDHGLVNRAQTSSRAPVSQLMEGLSELELRADQVLRDDSLWEGTGSEPVSKLRSMMVVREGEALRSGLRQLARRQLPDWVRARVRALQLVERTGPIVQALAPRRP